PDVAGGTGQERRPGAGRPIGADGRRAEDPVVTAWRCHVAAPVRVHQRLVDDVDRAAVRGDRRGGIDRPVTGERHRRRGAPGGTGVRGVGEEGDLLVQAEPTVAPDVDDLVRRVGAGGRAVGDVDRWHRQQVDPGTGAAIGDTAAGDRVDVVA